MTFVFSRLFYLILIAMTLIRLTVLIGLFSSTALADERIQGSVLYDFDDQGELDSIETRDIELSLVGQKPDTQLQLKSGHSIDWPGITLKPDDEFWDGSGYQNLSVDVVNTGDTAFEIGLRVDNPGDDAEKNRLTVMTYLTPGESRTISAALFSTSYTFSTPITLHGMHKSPGQSSIDPAKITQVILFLRQPTADHRFTIDNVRFETPMKTIDSKTFLPFIDEFGQFIHDEWPGKILEDKDLASRRESEQTDLGNNPGPRNFSQFGGWKNEALKLESQKHFRTRKVDGKWWLIDPDGYPFWSHGIDSVSTRFGGTGVEHREDYFRDLPNEDDDLGKFYYTSDGAHGFYASKIPYKSFNFYTANLYRKYGDDWQKEFVKLAHRRLRSWGFNTLGAWSDSEVVHKQTTPYTAFFRVENCPVLDGAESRWTKFVDVFDPQFKNAIRDGIFSCARSVGDPWCIGFFVDNELYWGDETSLAVWTLKSPAEQAAKKALVADLTAKYETIDALNEVWGTRHESWDALLESTDTPDLTDADEDLRAFSDKFCQAYFRTIASELDASAPRQLYLGCRFIWENESAIRAACKHCDVVSFNRYRYTVDDLKLPKGEDKPILISEFHFGALDRGQFHASKVPALNQQHRGECYKTFVRSALANPSVVGAHWFQYTSEPTSGRGDGENYQVGFVDICDTPYQETVESARTIGSQMYEYRATN